jgi:hypothetical protein
MSVVLTKSAPVTVYADEKGNFNRKYNKLRLQQLLVGSNYNNTGFSTAANPEITFNADPTSGLYLKANNVIGIGINNLEVGTIDSAGIHGAAGGGGTTDVTVTANWLANPAAAGTSTVVLSKIGNIVICHLGQYLPIYNGVQSSFSTASSVVPVGYRPPQVIRNWLWAVNAGVEQATPGLVIVDTNGFIYVQRTGDNLNPYFNAGSTVGWHDISIPWTLT